MAVSNVELRLTVLEAEMAGVKQKLASLGKTQADWLAETYGAFAEFPDYDKVIALGRKYRESLRPAVRKRSAVNRRTGKAPRRRR